MHFFFLYLWYVWQTQGPKVPEILEVAATLNQPLLMHIPCISLDLKVDRLVFCSGKIYYELVAERERQQT